MVLESSSEHNEPINIEPDSHQPLASHYPTSSVHIIGPQPVYVTYNSAPNDKDTPAISQDISSNEKTNALIKGIREKINSLVATLQ